MTENQPMKGIACCADCAYYSMKKHKCTRATDEGKPTDHFYADCPLPDVIPKQMWIPVSDRLPPEHDSIFAKLKGTEQWQPGMFQRWSDDVRVAVLFEDGTRMVSHDHTVDGKWHCEMEKCAYPKRTVTHWCENPPLPEERT